MPDLPFPAQRADPALSAARRSLVSGAAAFAGVGLAPILVLPRRAAADALPPVPYVSTPPDVVRHMLALGQVGRGDIVYDRAAGTAAS